MNQNSSVPLEEQYDQATRVITSEKQDETMQEYGDSIISRDYAFEESVDKSGNVKQNCADLVADIVDKAGNVAIGKPKIESGNSTRSGPYIWKFLGIELHFNKGEFKSPKNTIITWPNQQFKDFKNENGANDIHFN